LGEIAFGQSLHLPGKPPKQVLAMPGSRFVSEYLAVFGAQNLQARSAQVLDLYQKVSIHAFRV
jgi:hypothetical protein